MSSFGSLNSSNLPPLLGSYSADLQLSSKKPSPQDQINQISSLQRQHQPGEGPCKTSQQSEDLNQLNIGIDHKHPNLNSFRSNPSALMSSKSQQKGNQDCKNRQSHVENQDVLQSQKGLIGGQSHQAEMENLSDFGNYFENHDNQEVFTPQSTKIQEFFNYKSSLTQRQMQEEAAIHNMSDAQFLELIGQNNSTLTANLGKQKNKNDKQKENMPQEEDHKSEEDIPKVKEAQNQGHQKGFQGTGANPQTNINVNIVHNNTFNIQIQQPELFRDKIVKTETDKQIITILEKIEDQINQTADVITLACHYVAQNSLILLLVTLQKLDQNNVDKVFVASHSVVIQIQKIQKSITSFQRDDNEHDTQNDRQTDVLSTLLAQQQSESIEITNKIYQQNYAMSNRIALMSLQMNDLFRKYEYLQRKTEARKKINEKPFKDLKPVKQQSLNDFFKRKEPPLNQLLLNQALQSQEQEPIQNQILQGSQNQTENIQQQEVPAASQMRKRKKPKHGKKTKQNPKFDFEEFLNVRRNNNQKTL
eukprot:403371153